MAVVNVVHFAAAARSWRIFLLIFYFAFHMDTVDVEEEEEHHQEDVEGVEVGLLVYVQHFDDTLEYA